MTNDTKARGTRSIEVTIDIGAPPEAVWRALTDAEELVRWFPFEARVEPGAGGSIWSSWRGVYEGEAAIEVWEPERRLRLVYPSPPGAQAAPPPAPFACDYELEGKGGTTRLRLVHSGFSKDADWDAMFDGTRRGWNLELRGLKHYLEKHSGTPRESVWSRVVVDLPLEESWRRLTAALLPGADPSALGEGDRATLAGPDGEWRAEIVSCEAPRELAAFVAEHGDAYLRLRLDPSFLEPGRTEANLFLSTFGVERATVEALEAGFDRLLAERLG